MNILCIGHPNVHAVERLLSHLVREGVVKVGALVTSKHRLIFESAAGYFPSLAVEFMEVPSLEGHPDHYDPALVYQTLDIKSHKFDDAYVIMARGYTKMRYVPEWHLPPLKQNYNLFTIARRFSHGGVYGFGSEGVFRLSMDQSLDDYVNIHAGRRCFVFGNGPSLKDVDMNLFKDELAIGSNRIYLGYPDWGYAFKYWTIVDSLQCEMYPKEWEENIPDESIKFFPFEYSTYFKFPNGCPLNVFATGHPNNPTNYIPPNPSFELAESPVFSKNSDVVFAGHNTVYIMLQLAWIMGCDPIYLLGVDHRFNIPEKDKDKGIWRDDQSGSHFHKGYTVQQGKKLDFHLPNIDAATQFFNHAQVVAKKEDRRIINLTEGSALQSFPTAKLHEIL